MSADDAALLYRLLYGNRELLYNRFMGKISNYRFTDEVLQAIADLQAVWGCRSQVEVVSRAILEAHKGGSVPVAQVLPNSLQPAQLNRMEDVIAALPETIGDVLRLVVTELKTAKVAGAQPGAPSTSGEFSCACAHCGARFSGATKYASLCRDCQTAGHRNVRPHDCRECQGAVSI